MQKIQHDNSVSESHVTLMVPFSLVSGRFCKWLCRVGMSLEENVLHRAVTAFTLFVSTLFDNAIPAVKQ